MTIPPKATLVCEQFSIPALPVLSDKHMIIWNTTILNTTQVTEFYMAPHLSNSSRWPKLSYISDEFLAVYNFISNGTLFPPTPSLYHLHRYPLGIILLPCLGIIFLLLFILVYCYYCRRHSPPVVHFRAHSHPTIKLIS